MKKYIAVIFMVAFVMTSYTCVFAKTTVVKGPNRTVVVTKGPQKKIVVVKRYYFPKKTVVIVGRPYAFRPWKWRARIRILAVDVPARANPHPSAMIIGNLPKDVEFDVVQRMDGWMLVSFAGKQGWVHRDHVKVLKVEKVSPDKKEKLTEEDVKVDEGEE